ncbi:winged helix-turn-helix transcriptional regulator [Herbiconiux sp. CPCC 205763]|uniref:Winged helix-turn-helix transcriptional regulator n=1 Tax=Herbiconiux aconitum TaxID=2970913 RepID=A0ABT2GPH7_9MICO|nr:winged helix-turn-helix transcriptional regulator [Herbiconiux aconitum]MCS5717195.1 winged helix-turn-helix transcriptional regulator [Herbiconiux aconitum]
MAERSYDDACGAALAMDAVGERWALLVVRELIFGPKRFGDLRTGLAHASPNVLSQRLKELEADGIVRRTELGPPTSTHVYELTDRGRELRPVLIALSRWGAGVPTKPGTEMSADAVMLLLEALYAPPTGSTLRASIGIRLPGDEFALAVTPAGVTVRRGRAEHPDATIAVTVAQLRALVFGSISVATAVELGRVEAEGDLDLATRFFSAYPNAATEAS